MQDKLPNVIPNVPIGHKVQVPAPSPEYLPGAQSMQTETLLCPVKLLYLPAGHKVQLELSLKIE